MRSPVVLSDLAEKALRRHAIQAQARSLTVSCTIPRGLSIETHAELVGVIVDNWIANAIEYAAPDTQASIGATSDGARFTLTVANHAPDLTPEDIEHLFEPFWRKDAARANGAHSGLGLSLTQTIARALSFEVRAVLDADTTLRLELSGPLRSA